MTEKGSKTNLFVSSSSQNWRYDKKEFEHRDTEPLLLL